MRCSLFPTTLFVVVLQLFGLASSTHALTKDDFFKSLPKQLESIEVHPQQVVLTHKYEYVQLLVTGKLKGGATVDLTRLVKISDASGLVSVSPRGVVFSKKDGKGKLTLKYAGKQVEISVSASGYQQSPHANFIQDVMPAMSKMGCTAGTCHGAKAGKAGFKLSLRGYDPIYDLRALTDDIAGRRFNRAAPQQSLMLLKTSGGVPHVGGVLTRPGEPYYEILRTWIANGVNLDLKTPRVISIEVFPQKVVLPLADMTQQMKIIATYSDGTKQDVTSESFIEAGDIEILEADNQGLITSLRRGESAVLARYSGAYAAARVFVMGDRSGYKWSNPPVNNYVDELVYKKLQTVKVSASELSDDATFIRRVYLDLTGVPPTSKQVLAFLADPKSNQVKRDELIDSLIGSEEFIDHWTNKWADLLQVNRKFLSGPGVKALRDWIKKSVTDNKPYDQFVHEILSGSGSTLKNPAASYYQILRNPADLSENTTQLFLSIRFSCNKCHDHPFERWTQDQYYQMAAYFAQVGRKAAEGAKKMAKPARNKRQFEVEAIFDLPKGEMKHERTGAIAAPKFPYTHDDLLPSDKSRREQLAHWVTSPKNQYFARSYVNRIWAYLTGVGIIEPIDDIRAGNPPTNPELLDKLTSEFVSSKFDVRKLMATICKSRTYQLSVATDRWNEDDLINYSHRLPQRLTAEVLYDTVHKATGSQSRLPGMPRGARAAQLLDATVKLSDDFLTLFGRPPRESACECERSSGMMLAPIMNLVNGPTIANAISDPANSITKLVASEKDNAKVVEELFLRILNRHPSKEEVAACTDIMKNNNFVEELAKQKKDFLAYQKKVDIRQAKWEAPLQGIASVGWTEIGVLSAKSKAGATFTKNDDKTVIVGGKLGKDLYTIVLHTDLMNITGVRLEALTNDSLPKKGPGRAKDGNFVLSEFKLLAAPLADSAKVMPVGLQNAKADFSQSGFNVTKAIDSSGRGGWGIAPRGGKNHTAVFETTTNIGHKGGTLLTVTMQFNHTDKTYGLGHFRLSVTNVPRPIGLKGSDIPPAVLAAVQIDPAKRTPQQKLVATNYHRSLDEGYGKIKNQHDLYVQVGNKRLAGAQDVVWALINSPSFLFNR